MGAALLVTAVVVSSFRDDRGDARRPVADRRMVDAARKLIASPTTWAVGFVLLVAVIVGALLVALSGAPGSASLTAGAGLGMLAPLAGVVVAYFLWGVYHASRSRGLHRPAAVAAVAWMVGLFFVGTVVVRLLGGT